MSVLVLQDDPEGVAITLTLVDADGSAIDVSGATTKNILLDPPNNTAVETHAASFVTDGSNGQITYTTAAGDIDTPGRWGLQAEIRTASGYWKSEIAHFVVRENLV